MDRKNGKIIALRSIIPIALVLLLVLGWIPNAQAAPKFANILGEIERITLDTPGDHWSGGTIVVGGQIVILPRNLLLDLPANRLTLNQLFEQAPAACLANGESGLAKADVCNQSGAGGFAILSANRSDFGNVIAGDVFLQKGQESVTGTVTVVNYNDGYYRLSGQPGIDNAGVIVRLNDPTGRHTVQQGLGCAVGSDNVNCSPDPRFTLDPDNYTNVFSNGFPYCLPSTVSRSFTNILGDNVTSSASAGDGTGDYLCPDTNRPASLNTPAADSRRFAPLKVGDTVTAEGNFETIDNVTFLSAHTSTVGVALPSAITAGQPDYFFLAEVFMDAPAFFNKRYRSLVIGYTTLANPATDVLFWTIHRGKVNNEIHEVPWASVLGCDAASGAAGTCSSQGLAGAGGNIFRIRHDVDFINAAVGVQRFGGADPKLSPCAHLRAEPRFGNPTPFCPSATAAGSPGDGTGSLAEEFGTFTPIPHEIMGRTGRKVADTGGTIRNIDVNGNEATWGQYLFPFGVNLGGISLQEMNEIDLNLMDTPSVFEGIPWNLDRRLGPGGCNGACEADVAGNPYAYALNPFPYSGLHPKTALALLVGGTGGLPTGQYNDPNFTASSLTDVQDRMFSFVNTSGVFDGNNTVINNTQLANLAPPAFPILETPPLPLPPPLPANAVTLAASPVGTGLVGDNVTFNALASGGSGTYEYQFMAKVVPAGTFVIAQAYGPSAAWTWDTTGASPGIYEIQVFARSVGSTAAVEAINTLVYTLTVPAATGATLTPTPPSPVIVGDNVVFTASATSGTGTYQYQFWYRSVGAATFFMVQDYGVGNTFTWRTSTESPGSYEWQVFARSTGSTAVSEAVSPIVPFVVNASQVATITSVTLFSTPASPQPLGTSVSFIGVGAGGSGTYEYQFSYRLSGTTTYTIGQAFGTNSVWSWNTTGATGGNYDILVSARSVGTTAEVSSTATYLLTGGTGAATNVSLVSTPASTGAVGDNVVFTAAASGGSGSYEYQFWLYSGGSWSVMQTYSTSPTWTWHATAGDLGGHYVWVDVRNAGSTAANEAWQQIAYTVTGGVSSITVGFTSAPANSAVAGDNVIFTATATGGSGSYEYRFWLYSGGVWSVAQPYGASNTWTWHTTVADQGSHFVWVDVRNLGSLAEVEAYLSIGYLVQ